MYIYIKYSGTHDINKNIYFIKYKNILEHMVRY